MWRQDCVMHTQLHHLTLYLHQYECSLVDNPSFSCYLLLPSNLVVLLLISIITSLCSILCLPHHRISQCPLTGPHTICRVTQGFNQVIPHILGMCQFMDAFVVFVCVCGSCGVTREDSICNICSSTWYSVKSLKTMNLCSFNRVSILHRCCDIGHY